MHEGGMLAFDGTASIEETLYEVLKSESKMSGAEEGQARREGAEVMKEMSRSPTIQKSRTGNSAPEEETPKPPSDESRHTSDSVPKGAGKPPIHWQPFKVT